MRSAIVIGMAAATLASTGCARERSESPGPATTRNYQVGPFQRLEVAGPYDVTVATGGAPSVSASGGENAIAQMVVEVTGDTLKIHPEKRSGMSFGWSDSSGAPVKLTVTVPSLSAAELAGSGNIAVDKVAGDKFEAEVAGSGGLRLGQVDVQRLKADIAGSGKFHAGTGHAAVAQYGIAGSGDIDAAGLVTETSSVSIAGSGNVTAQATGTAKVDIAGSGDVKLSGGAKCTVSRAGSGNVDCS
ncbi:MAG: head GIN domain-containing protein [Sphingomicrobium sp.]